jgi:hypothetical protein
LFAAWQVLKWQVLTCDSVFVSALAWKLKLLVRFLDNLKKINFKTTYGPHIPGSLSSFTFAGLVV